MLLILALLAGLAASGLAQTPQPASLIVTNAKIYTADPALPVARSMAIRNGRIIVLDSDAVPGGPKTQVLDLGGAVVLPGLIDSHTHMASLGSMMETFDLRHVATVAEVAAIVKQRATRAAKGQWIRGRSWDQTNWGGEFPDAKPLTEAAPENPVYLTRVDGHAGWVNRRALELAGITRNTPDPPGGRIIHDAKGEPTGVLIDRAQALVTGKIPPPSDDEVVRRIQMAAVEYARLGVTSVQDAGVDAQEIHAYRTLIAARRMPVRVYAMIMGAGPHWEEWLKRGPEVTERLSVRSIKLMADGAMGSRGAAFWQPYSDDLKNTGLMMLTREKIEAVARQAVARGFQVNTHAIGDRANHTVLEAYAAVLQEGNNKRFRIEHAQVVALPDIGLFKKYSIIASMQSSHATSDMRWAEQRLGPDRMKGAYAQKRMLDAGVVVANGSDSPVEEPNPFLGFYAAVSRQDLNGKPKGGWFPDQRMTREEALRSFTWAGAYASFEEDRKGTLSVGKYGDFIVLDRDVMTIPEIEIPKTRVRMTYVAGEAVVSDQ